MKKLVYLECPTGIAGDMVLGALVDAGVPLDYLIEQLARLGISDEYELRVESVQRHHQVATQVQVNLKTEFSDADHQDHEHSSSVRHLPEIEQKILAAQLPAQAEAWSLAVFRKLAEAEGAVHGISPKKVHFHEVGATDAIVDIVGTCLGLAWLGVEQLYCSPMPTGGGTVKAAHGVLTVPVPAVLKLWEMRQVPVYSNGIERELCTPTGVAIACTLATQFGKPPAMRLQRVGLGAGTRQLPIANVLRLWLGEAETGDETGDETVMVLETQIDDTTPQAIAYVFDELFAAGALDVFTQPIVMKKSRLGVLLTVICWPDQVSVCERILFRETPTLGIRRSPQQRSILQREIQRVQTPYGNVRVKVAWMGQEISNVQPEYEDCAQLAREHHLSWRAVHQMVLSSWYVQFAEFRLMDSRDGDLT